MIQWWVSTGGFQVLVHIAPSIKWHKLKLQGLVSFFQPPPHKMHSCWTFVLFSTLRSCCGWERKSVGGFYYFSQ